MAIYVSSGVVSSGVVLKNDSMYVLSSGTAVDTTVNDSGYLYVSSGGVANATTVNSSGSLYVSSGGVANDTVVNSGSLYVYAGGSASVRFDDPWHISQGITAKEGAEVTYSNVEKVYYGNSQAVLSKGSQFENLTVTSSKSAVIYSGGVANHTTMSGGCLYVSCGGTANDTLMSSYFASMTIVDGGMANHTIVSSFGRVYVLRGGMASGTVLHLGDLYVSDGGVANETTVNSRGCLYVSDGGVANHTTIQGSGYDEGLMVVFSGGVANHTTVNGMWNRIGYLYVSSGGVANDTTVDSRGDLCVRSGGSAFNVIWTPCVGNVSIEDGAYVTYTSSYTGVYFGSGNQLLFHAVTMAEKTVDSNCRMYVMNGGTADAVNVSGNGNGRGFMSIWSRGAATRTSVNQYGTLDVSSGGVANNTTVNSGGSMTVSNGGSAMAIRENGGYVQLLDGANVSFVENTFGGWILYYAATVHAGTTALDITVSGTAGNLHVSCGGVASGTTIAWHGTMYVSDGGLAKDTIVNYGDLHVRSGGLAKDTIVNYGDLHISNGGLANTITMNGGTLYVSDGGLANSATVNNSGHLRVSSGGVASNTTINSGFLYVSSGGVANKTTVNSGGYLGISAGGSATNVIWTPCEGTVSVADGAYVTYASSYTGVYFGSNNQLLSHTDSMTGKTVTGSMYVMNGGVANKTTVSGYNASMTISSGGVANGTSVNGGYLSVFNSGVANNTMVRGDYWYYGGISAGFMTIFSGGAASGTAVNVGGNLYVSGGMASDTTIQGNYDAQHFTWTYGSMVIANTGTASGTTVNGGGIVEVLSSGTASGTTVNSGGRLDVSYNGMASSTTVHSGGMLNVNGGASARAVTVESAGEIVIAGNGLAAQLTVVSGGIINHFSFDQDLYWETVQGTAITVPGGWTIVDGTITVGAEQKAEHFTVHSGGTVLLEGTAEELQIKAGGGLDQFVFGEDLSVNKDSSGVIELASGVTITEQLLTVASGAALTGVALYGSAAVQIASGATLSGFLRNSATQSENVAIASGARIDLQITGPSGSNALIENVASEELRNAEFAITIDAPEVGSYVLYNGDCGTVFSDKAITVKTADGTELGTLSTNDTYTILTDGTFGYKLSTSSTAYSNGLTLDVLGHIYVQGGSGYGTYSGLYNSVTSDAGSYYAELPAGYTVDCCSFGAASYVGWWPVTPYYQIRDASQTNITESCRNAGLVSESYGCITVVPASCSVSLNEYSKVYDGEFLTSDFIRDNLLSVGGLCDSDRIQINNVSFQSYSADVGQVGYTVDFSIVDYGGGTNVTECYSINGCGCGSSASVQGWFSITPREVTLTSGDANKTYDGSQLANYSVTDGGDGWANGEGASYTVTGSQLDAGTSKNTFSYTLNDNTKAENYNITTVEGTLTVSQRDVTLTSGDAAKVYDGKALTNDTVTVSGSGWADGEGATCSVTGSQLFVGQSDNSFSYTLNSNTKAGNYDVTKVNGKLVVTKRTSPLAITVHDEVKTYDGTACLSTAGYTVVGELAYGDTLTVNLSNTNVNAGTYVDGITATYKIMHDNGNGTSTDVTDMYANVTVDAGDLTINKRDVTIESASDSKFYDGTPLTNHNTYLSSGSFVAGEGYVANVTGSQTAVGSSSNAFTVSGAAGTNLNNYAVTKIEGTLTVTGWDQLVTITADSDSKMYDGTELTDSGYTVIGLAAGHYLANVTVNGSITHFGIADNVVTSYTICDANSHDVTAAYSNVQTVKGQLVVTKRDAALISGSASKEYDGLPLTEESVTVTGSGFVGGEGACYYNFGSQTAVGSSANEFSYVLNNGTSADDYAITTVEGTLTVTRNDNLITITADSNSKMYDGSALTDSGYTVTGSLAAGDYFASVTVEGSITDAGTVANKVTGYTIVNQAGDDVTSFYSNVQTVNGTLEITKRDVTLTSASDSKVYDGTALTNSNVTVSGSGWADGEGATYNVTGSQTLAGSSANTFTYTLNDNTKTGNYEVTTVEGTLEVTPAALVVTVRAGLSFLYDNTATKTLTEGQYVVTGLAQGDKVVNLTITTNSANAGTYDQDMYTLTYDVVNASGVSTKSSYVITEVKNDVEITKRTITVVADSASKVYDGTALTCHTYTFVEGATEATKLLTGEKVSTVTFTADSTLTNAGSTANKIDEVSIIKADGTSSVMNYNIVTEKGTLEVTKRNVTLASSNAHKKYDGTALVGKVAVFGDGFVDGEATATASTLTDVGTIANTITIHEGTGYKESNYNITRQEGTLEVTKRNVTLTSGDAAKTYDGTQLANDEITASGDGWVTGEGAIYEFFGSQLDVGSSENSFSYLLNGNTKAGNYNISTVDGTLTVTKRSVTLTSGDAAKPYDGTPLTNDAVTVSGDGWTTGEGASYKVTGSQLDVGSSSNTFSYTLNGNTKAGNYNVTKVEGTLTVTAPFAKSDVDGNGISDVMFQYTGGNYQIGFWMNGTSTWQGTGASQPAEWDLLGNYDMDNNGKADQVMVGNVEVGGVKGAYVGFYKDGDTTANGWQNIGYLSNSENIAWDNAVGNLTGNAGANSIVWHAAELGALGVWTDGTDNWVSLGSGFDANWELQGCGDFTGDGADEVLWKYSGTSALYTTDINGNFATLGTASGLTVRAIGDFTGDGIDDIVLFSEENGVVLKYENGLAENWSALGQLDVSDWFIVGAGDYNNDQQDDLLVRQYSTGMLGYYSAGDMTQWNELGRGVDMQWTVVA